MTWLPNASVDIARARAAMLEGVRAFFRARDVLEVTTPALTTRTATDPHTGSLVTRVDGKEAFLHTSPEHFMKRLLSAGYPDVFQVCSVFRDGERGRHHLPEFTMVEWYRHGFSLRAIMRDTVELVSGLVARQELQQPTFLSYSQAFGDALSLDPLTADDQALACALEADTALRESVGKDANAWLDLAMASRVAPSFAADRLTVVFHYPANQAALARLCPEDNRLADRFELYWGQIELANGFVELTDADEQERRFRGDQAKRRSADLPVYRIDENLIAALRAGMPPCAGVALGLDRLLMIDEGLDDIRGVTTFTPGADDDG